MGKIESCSSGVVWLEPSMMGLFAFSGLEDSAFINAAPEGISATLSHCLYWSSKLLTPLTVENLMLEPGKLDHVRFGPFSTLQELLESCFWYPWYCVFTPVCLLDLCFSRWWKWVIDEKPLFRVSTYFCFRQSLNVDHPWLGKVNDKARRRHTFWLFRILLLRRHIFKN